MTQVTVVVGPPLAGKSTYVRANAQSGDVVFDYDSVHSALSLLESHQHDTRIRPYVFAVRAALYRRLREPGVDRAWIINSTPSKARVRALADQFSEARVVVLMVERVEAHKRADADGRPAVWHEYIDNWFAAADYSQVDFPDDSEGERGRMRLNILWRRDSLARL
jgi:predicted kinase